MRLYFSIQPATDDDSQRGPHTRCAILLPRGCGIDEASEQITNAIKGMRDVAFELFKAETEGREPKFENLPKIE